MNKAVFLDKDGTIVRDVSYNADPDKIELLPGVGTGLRALQKEGYRLIVITNQSGIARGYFSIEQFKTARGRLEELLADEGVRLEDLFYCPHYPAGIIAEFAQTCLCRKPRPGMIFEAARKHSIDLPHSWMIGDILHDIEAGYKAGCKTILIDNGNETEWKLTEERTPDFKALDLSIAANHIITRDQLKETIYKGQSYEI